MKKHLKKFLRNLKKLRLDHDSNLNILIECIAIIMIWRGVWDLLEIYVFPDSPLESNLLCVIIGIIILLIDDGKLGELQEEDHHRGKKSS